MTQILLSQLTDESKDVTLRLRLLHCWKAASPVMPEAFFAYSLLWVDGMGARIEGTALPVHAEHLEARLRLDFFFPNISLSFTSCTSSNRYLQFTSTANFEEVGDP
ncbi:hypothetical protein LINPERHAP2_LOCUS7617, partial [Linum perenne]